MIKFKNIGAKGSFNPARPDVYNGIVPYNAIVPFSQPVKIEWLSQESKEKEDFFFYFDESIKQGLNVPGQKYGFLLESMAYLRDKGTWSWIVNDLIQNQELYKQHYKYIFTCCKDLIDRGAPFTYRIAGGSKLKRNEKSIHNKNKLVSMFVSNASVLPNHHKRIAYKNKYQHCMDVYGRGINALSDDDYVLAYKDYMFVITFENDNTDYFFSEKLLDPILTGAVPVYCGSKNAVSKYFDERGILWAEEINPEKDLTKELYNSMKPYIISNFYAALRLPTIEDYIYENYLKVL